MYVGLRKQKLANRIRVSGEYAVVKGWSKLLKGFTIDVKLGLLIQRCHLTSDLT